jgi:hypothetical protein
MKDFLKKIACCFNPYVVGAVTLGVIAFYIFNPDIDISPVLLLALICPLSMIIMLFMMKK